MPSELLRGSEIIEESQETTQGSSLDRSEGITEEDGREGGEQVAEPDKARQAEGAFIAFDRGPVTTEAAALVVDLLGLLLQREQQAVSPRKRARDEKAQARLTKLVGQFAGELVAAVDRDIRPELPCHLGSAALNRLGVSQRMFRPLFAAFCELGLIEVSKNGFWMRIPEFGPLAGKGMVTRIRPTDTFLGLTRQHGIARNSADRHFPQLGMPIPLELRTGSLRIGRMKLRGRPVEFSETSKTAKLRADVEELNAFIRERCIEGIDGTRLTGWMRIFHRVKGQNFDWDGGGRLYARLDNATYQSRSGVERTQLRIDEEAVVEIDIRSSHLAIVYALNGISPHDHFRAYNEDGWSWRTADPYEVPGLPRPVVKSWVTATLGNGKPPKRWSPTAKEDLAEEGIDPQAFPIQTVAAAVLQKHPILADHGAASWAKLQYVESEAIIGTMLRLKRDHGIPALPVHDSLIVPQPAWWVALRVLQDELEAVTGFKPMLPKLSPDMEKLPPPHHTRDADQISRYFKVKSAEPEDF